MDEKITFKTCAQKTMNLSLDDGRELLCDILTIMRFGGQDYVVLMPQTDEDGEAFIYGFGVNEAGQPDLRSITDRAELEKVLHAFDVWYEQSDDERIPVDVFSGFLGAGKTTLIKKLLAETYAGQQVVLIENEFGVENIDAGFLGDSDVEIKEISAGCICCSMTGDFTTALQQVVKDFQPDRIVIEPSGVGKLSDIIAAVEQADPEHLLLDHALVVADASKCHVYMLNFGEFYNDQIRSAQGIILSHTGKLSEERLAKAVESLRKLNPSAPLIVTPWEQLTGDAIFDAIDGADPLALELDNLELPEEPDQDEDDHDRHEHHHHDDDDDDDDEHEHHHHHDDDDDDDDEHEHHHHHDDDDDDDDEHEHHHHHDDDDDDDDEHEHHHHHDDDDDDDDHDHEGHCCHHHHGPGHHHAEDVFGSWGGETVRRYSQEELLSLLGQLSDEQRFGQVLRAKGIVSGQDGQWIHFDYVPGEPDVRLGSALPMGRIGVIGAHLQNEALEALFRLK